MVGFSDGRRRDRTNLGVEFGPTEVVAERGGEGIAHVWERTDGMGTHAVLECVGILSALEMGLGVVRPGSAISGAGVPQYGEIPFGFMDFAKYVTITGGVAPARAYMEELLPGILEGKIEPDREAGGPRQALTSATGADPRQLRSSSTRSESASPTPSSRRSIVACAGLTGAAKNTTRRCPGVPSSCIDW
ncbi:hypothetical protein BIV25_28575 [Streptomyces sp. MUSC 14]|nr:zinc-binding dehydrogenase [Streptomyces sp. MUSC 14]OIJ91733.1 hypothetical protein BIV25_28575 [Streptomyces sp. MUSC 14]